MRALARTLLPRSGPALPGRTLDLSIEPPSVVQTCRF